MDFNELFKQAKQSASALAAMTDDQRNGVLLAVADAIEADAEMLLAANAEDLKLMDAANPLFDRLRLTPNRLADIAADMRHVASLPTPLGRTLKERTLDNGLHLRRVSVPFGVIGMIYEARPNVTFDVFSLCFKSGNACILKGGSDADHSNQAAISLIHRILQQQGVCTTAATLLPSTHEATAALLSAVGFVDLCIPRGGKRLIQFVRQSAKVPVIETGAGVVHCYFDEAGDAAIGRAIITNAKCRRCSVCNALDTLLVHERRLASLPELCQDMAEKGVVIHADAAAMAALRGHYPAQLLRLANGADTWDTEWLSLQMGIRTVPSLDEALLHIAQHGSGHSESIVSEDAEACARFQQAVDAACVYVNVPTSFTDGAQFGLGAEIGISTQKLGARGPMALEEITTYKWLITGHGQTRS